MRARCPQCYGLAVSKYVPYVLISPKKLTWRICPDMMDKKTNFRLTDENMFDKNLNIINVSSWCTNGADIFMPATTLERIIMISIW